MLEGAFTASIYETCFADDHCLLPGKTIIINIICVFPADSRSLNIYERNVPEITEEATVKMQALVKKLKFKYDPTIFRDPHLEVRSDEAIRFNYTN